MLWWHATRPTLWCWIVAPTPCSFPVLDPTPSAALGIMAAAGGGGASGGASGGDGGAAATGGGGATAGGGAVGLPAEFMLEYKGIEWEKDEDDYKVMLGYNVYAGRLHGQAVAIKHEPIYHPEDAAAWAKTAVLHMRARSPYMRPCSVR